MNTNDVNMGIHLKHAAMAAVGQCFLRGFYKETIGAMSLDAIYKMLITLPEVTAYFDAAINPAHQATRKWIIKTEISIHLKHYIDNK